jgi:hypothetical protein
MDNWLRLLQAAASGDCTTCAEVSRSLGYLTEEENEVRLSHTYFHLTPIDAPNTDHARRSHRLNGPPSDPF